MEIEIRDLAGSFARIVLRGSLDTAGAGAIETKLAATAGARDQILVDMAGVGFLSSMGIRALLLNGRVVIRRSGRIVLLQPQEQVEGVLKTSGIDQILPIFHDEAAAMAYLAGGVAAA